MSETGAITGYIDVAQVVLYLFWAFFAGLIIYLRREDKREGYPLESDRSDRVTVQGFPAIPKPKRFLLRDGSTRTAPSIEAPAPAVPAEPISPWPGAPLEPKGEGLGSGVGPGAFAERADDTDKTLEGHDRIVPLRVATTHRLDPKDPNPIGMEVMGADRKPAGTVVDAWVDRTEPHLRYLEVEFKVSRRKRRVLLPMYFARVHRSPPHVEVNAILAEQFAGVPRLKDPDRVTLREEDQISAYYGGGLLYADPSRQEPIL